MAVADIPVVATGGAALLRILEAINTVDQGTATLVAACIAAAASAITVVGSVISRRDDALRAAHRRALEPHLADLSAHIHEVLACSTVYLKSKQQSKGEREWRERGAQAKKELGLLRLRIRYPLWGLDDGLRVLTRIPDWATHKRADETQAKALITAAEKLRVCLDDAIRRSYLNGRPPIWRERRRVQCMAVRCRRAFGDSAVDDSEPANPEE